MITLKGLLLPTRATRVIHEVTSFRGNYPIASKHLIGVKALSFSRYEPSPSGINGKSEFNKLFQWMRSCRNVEQG